MKNIFTEILHSIHTVESRLNHVECKYNHIVREDDFGKVYGLLSDLCHETVAVKEWIDIFMKCDSSTLQVFRNILAEHLNNESSPVVITEFTNLKRIVETVINIKK